MNFTQARKLLYKHYPSDKRKIFLMSPKQIFRIAYEIKRKDTKHGLGYVVG